MRNYTITFLDSDAAEITLPDGSVLSEHLDAENSPVLFGCRAGICGTCLCEIYTNKNTNLHNPDNHEQEALDIYAPNNPHARLACQFILKSNITIKPIKQK